MLELSFQDGDRDLTIITFHCFKCKDVTGGASAVLCPFTPLGRYSMGTSS